MKHSILLFSVGVFALAAHAEPLCLPAEAGGAGTATTQRLVYTGGVVADKHLEKHSDKKLANGGTLAAGGKAVWWWCPQSAFNGQKYWALEWFGWEFEIDQFMGMQPFRVDDADSVRAAWQATRQINMSRTYFPANVVLAAGPTRPKPPKGNDK